MIEEIDPRLRSQASPATDLINLLSQKVVGQSSATKAIVPYVYMYQSGLAPEGRPAGVLLLLGPTGTGRTKTDILNFIRGAYRRTFAARAGSISTTESKSRGDSV